MFLLFLLGREANFRFLLGFASLLGREANFRFLLGSEVFFRFLLGREVKQLFVFSEAREREPSTKRRA